MKTTFDYGKWLLNRSEKDSTKEIEFKELTKKEKVETLLNLLGKDESDFKNVTIAGTEEKAFSDCSAQARAGILMQECETAVREKRMPNIPAETDIVSVPIKTGFPSASLVSKINYLSGLYGKPIDKVTISLPCGKEWISGLIDFIKSMDTAE
jgi:hypothetical protein